MMNQHMLNRRRFLQRSGVLAVSAGLASGSTLFPVVASRAAEIDSAKLQSVVDFLEQERQAGTFPGAAVVASCGGEVCLEHYTGTYHSLQGEDQPYHRDVRCLFYSYSKGISATSVMMALQEGLLDIDAPVAHYIPEFGAHGKETITSRHIMTHSAGIPSAPSPFMPLRNQQEWDAAIKVVCQAKPEWTPGSRTGYHALALMIPAEIVRRALQHPTWDAICRQRLFEPLAASTLTFDVPPDASLVVGAPQDSNRSDSAHTALAGHPAGGCYGTLADGLRVLQLHLNQGTWGDQTLLQRSTFEQMHTVQYAKEIAAALDAGQPPKHEPWAVGWLMRSEGPPQGGSDWFGFRDQRNPRIFGHAGIDTLIGVADPDSNVALMFNTTRSPSSNEETIRVRNEVTNRVMAALSGGSAQK